MTLEKMRVSVLGIAEVVGAINLLISYRKM
jgi:hypothetical protein